MAILQCQNGHSSVPEWQFIICHFNGHIIIPFSIWPVWPLFICHLWPWSIAIQYGQNGNDHWPLMGIIMASMAIINCHKYWPLMAIYHRHCGHQYFAINYLPEWQFFYCQNGHSSVPEWQFSICHLMAILLFPFSIWPVWPLLLPFMAMEYCHLLWPEWQLSLAIYGHYHCQYGHY